MTTNRDPAIGQRRAPAGDQDRGQPAERSVERRLDQDADPNSRQRKGAGMGQSRQETGAATYQDIDTNTGRNIGANTDQRSSEEVDDDLLNQPTADNPLDRR
jgi:hypothetical protein